MAELTVSLKGPAPAQGATVTLQSTAPVVTVPPAVVVPAGANSAVVPISTAPVDESVNVVITATYDGAAVTLGVRVTAPPPRVAAVTLADPHLGSNQQTVGTVTLDRRVDSAGVEVVLSVSHPDVSVPTRVVVDANLLSATFTVVNRSTASSLSSVTISAAGGGAIRTTTLTLVPAIPLSLQQTSPVALGFDRLSGFRLPFLSYQDSAFAVTVTSGDWINHLTYGRPEPSVVFTHPGVAEVSVTSDGRPIQFTSIDLYSSVTRIPYEFIGMAGTEQRYVITGSVQAFGSFITVQNPSSSTPITRLIVRLTNTHTAGPTLDFPGNPVGFDNIVMRR